VLQVTSAERTFAIRRYALSTALIYRLRRDGQHPVTGSRSFEAKLGPYYTGAKHFPDHELQIDDRLDRVPRGARVLVHLSEAAMREQQATPAPFPAMPVYVSIRPVPADRICPPVGPSVSPQRRRPVVAPGAAVGVVDRSKRTGGLAVFCGWAVTRPGGRSPDAVALVVGGRPVGAVKPTVSRPDVLRAMSGVSAPRVGFSLAVPVERLRDAGAARTVRVVALVGARGSALRFDCAAEPQEFGC
jgi:hypothetical protein